MQTTGIKETYLEFMRELVIGMMTKHGHKPKIQRSLSCSATRLDVVGHLIVSVKDDKRKNCKQCSLMGKRMQRRFICRSTCNMLQGKD